MTARARQRVTPRADRHGYALDGREIDGFADRPDLPLVDRLAIARMASRSTRGSMSAVQRDLIARADARPRRASSLLRAFTENATEDEIAFAGGLYDLLSSQQRSAVRESGFPVSVGQLAVMVGASERQIRHWTDLGLLPSHRVSGQRRFFSAGAVYAALLVSLPNHQIATLASLARPSRRSSPLVAALGATLQRVAPRIKRTAVQQDLLEAGARLQHASAAMSRAS